jgi:hypothetical protein
MNNPNSKAINNPWVNLNKLHPHIEFFIYKDGYRVGARLYSHCSRCGTKTDQLFNYCSTQIYKKRSKCISSFLI